MVMLYNDGTAIADNLRSNLQKTENVKMNTSQREPTSAKSLNTYDIPLSSSISLIHLTTIRRDRKKKETQEMESEGHY